MFFYRGFEDMTRLIRANYQSYSNYDLVLGVPRSGLIPASLFSLYLNVPLSTPELLSEGKLLSGGFRIQDNEGKLEMIDSSVRVLVVDDSCASGDQLLKTKKSLNHLQDKYSFTYLAVYAHINSKKLVDKYLELVPLPRLFEWNILNHMMLEHSCVDIDGVLCPDPTDEQNDDGRKYRSFIKNVACLIKPRFRIHSLVTSRLEKYRPETEQWLEKHNINYDHLIMSTHETAEQRRASNDHAERKAAYYLSSNTRLFIESDINQAKLIYDKTKKPVYCVDQRIYFNPLDEHNMVEFEKSRNRQMKRSTLNLLYTDAKEVIKKVIKSGK